MASSSSAAAAAGDRWEGRFRASTLADHRASGAPPAPVPPQEQRSNEVHIKALDPSLAYPLLESGMPCMVHLLPEFQKVALSSYVSHRNDLDVQKSVCTHIDVYNVGVDYQFAKESVLLSKPKLLIWIGQLC